MSYELRTEVRYTVMVNEKTLELNLSHELMRLIWVAGYDALLMGLNQLEEEAHGFDAGIISSSRILLLQYKRGHQRRNWISFRLNNNSNKNQHSKLLATCTNRTGVCYYAFPRICNWIEMVRYRGRLLQQTVFYDVVDVPITPQDRKPHTMRLLSDDTIEVLSEPIRVKKPVRWQQILKIPTSGDEPLPGGSDSPESPEQPNVGMRLGEFLDRIESMDMSPAEKAHMRILLISSRGQTE